MDSRQIFDIETGKKEGLVKTGILDKFIKDGQMERLSKRIDGRYLKIVYKITKDSKMYIFKSISCTPENSEEEKEEKENLTKRHEINLKSSKLTEGVVKPLNNNPAIAKKDGDLIMEIIYEYSGENLLSLMGKKEPQDIMRYMMSVAQTMEVLEKNNICHYDLKPANIVMKDDKVKIIDFGISRSFESQARLDKTTAVHGYSDLYSPPEVIKNQRGHPTKIDVFCWGMTLYQLITNKSIKDLKAELEARKKDHRQLLEQIKAIKIPGNPDLIRKTREILLCVLSEKPQDRPTFKELCESLQDGKTKELEGRRILIEQRSINNEEDKESHTKLRDRLFNELRSENIKVYEDVKHAYNNIVRGEALCDLNGVCIGHKGVRLLAFALNESKNLKELNLGFNRIQVEDIKVLAEGLKKCNTLEILILGEEATSSDDFKAGNSKEDLRERILKAVVAPGALVGAGVVIHIGKKIGIGAKIASAATKIAALASKASFAIKLGACVTGIGACVVVGVVASVVIYKAYKNYCEESKSKHSKSNNLEIIGTIAIANYLRNSRLRRIDLSYCNISSEVIQYLVDAANACNTLKFINIKENPKLKGIKPKFRSGLNYES